MDPLELMHRLGVAFAIGLLVGVERHWQERSAAAGMRTAGVRTFALTGLMGGITGALAGPPAQTGAAGLIVIGLIFLGFSAALVVFKLREARAEHSFSVTGVVAGQATFLLGVLALRGDMMIAGAAGVALTALLASRNLLHGFVERLRWGELRSAILLLSMTLLALPLLPDRDLGEVPGLNPHRIWTFAIILASLSYLGYVAVRLYGTARGRVISGALGGLVSSTAVTLAHGRMAGEGHPPKPLAAGALMAGAVSILRTGALAWMLAPMLAPVLGGPLLVAALVQGAIAFWLARDAAQGQKELAEPGNPFEIGSVLRMAGLLGAVAIAVRLASDRFGASGLIAVAGLSGLVDVDAVTISVTGAMAHGVSARDAALAILVALVSNALAKSVYAGSVGGGAFARSFALGNAASVIAGASIFVLLA
jgi:uncharacterized membrane protein (DUF4010 family)